jgi:hemoglobin
VLDEDSVYEFIGGEEAFRRLVAAFYRGVETDPLLRPMYPEGDLTEAQDRLSLFLMQYWGGPRTYDAQRGHPRLRMRHFPFHVGPAARDAWLKHMNAAVEEVAVPEPARTMMLTYFHNTANFLMNREE